VSAAWSVVQWIYLCGIPLAFAFIFRRLVREQMARGYVVTLVEYIGAACVAFFGAFAWPLAAFCLAILPRQKP
jgi:hypothetical protein